MIKFIILKSLYGVKYTHGPASISALMHLQAWKQPRILKNKLKKIKAQKAFIHFFQKLWLKLNFLDLKQD